MAANQHKEKLYDLDELQKLADADVDLAGFDITTINRQLINSDKPRKTRQRLRDYLTDNGQRLVRTDGDGYAVIPLIGWAYPAGVIRGKKKLIVIEQRLRDYLTDNGQRLVRTDGDGYAVIPLIGWAYPAGVIRGKKKLIVIDWYNRKGAIRTKDSDRYQKIHKRYQRDLRYYKANIDRLRKEYQEAFPQLTSMKFWENYLDLD